jgi:hypothetical protein
MKQGFRARVGGRGVTALVALSLSVASVVFAAPASAERSAADKAADAGLPSVTDQMQYRAELGLPASNEIVTDLNARWAAGDLPDAHVEGSVFTAAEQSELDAREAAAHDIAKAARTYFTGSLAGVLGGIYIDHATGKTVVWLTGNTAANLAALRSRVANPDRLVGKSARFSLADLERVGDTVMSKGSAFKVTGTSVDERANLLDVSLDKNTAAARAGVLGLLRPSEAAMVRFSEAHASERVGVLGKNAPPVKGGQGINIYGTNGTAASCTSAFVGYLRTRTDIGIYTNTYYALSAGHCDLTTNASYTQADLYVYGQSDRRAYTSGGSADGVRIPLQIQTDASQYVAITATNDRLIYDRQAAAADVVGERTCMSGARTGGEKCGTIMTRTFQGADASGFVLKNMRIATFDAIPGDSGGSVLNNSQAKGIVSCRVPYSGASRMCYTHIQYNLSGLGITDVYGV